MFATFALFVMLVLIGVMLWIRSWFKPTAFDQPEPDEEKNHTAHWNWDRARVQHELNEERNAQTRAVFSIGIGVVTLVFLLCSFFATFTTVGGNEIGVPVSFGRVGAEMHAGPHFKAPWVSVETYPTRPFTVQQDQDAVVRSAQNGQFSLRLGVRWHTVLAKELWFQSRSGNEDEISKKIVDPLLAQAARNAYSGLSNTDGIRNAAANEKLIKDELQLLVDKYGIAIDDVYVRKAEPDQRTSDVIAQLTAQQQQTAIATAQLATAQQQNAVVKQQAQNAKDAAEQLPSGLSQQQVLLYCAKLWADTQAQAIARGVTLYTSPCSATTANVLVGAK